MQRKNYILPYTLLALAFVACILFIGSGGGLRFLENILQVSFFSAAKVFHGPSSEDKTLKAQNIHLMEELAQKQRLEEDNKALRDQFESRKFPTASLLPARVVGQPSVIPNVTYPEELIIDIGEKDGVEKGSVVVVKDSAVGQVSDVSDYFAKVRLTSSKQFALSGKDSNTGAVGVIKGLGNGEILFDAVLLSDTLKVGDIIVSSGSQDMSGRGFPPDIVIGKITGVEKNPSSLFQSARVAPILELQKVSMVFILKRL